MSMSAEDWDDHAIDRLADLVATEGAVVPAEAEAKLSERGSEEARPINPHHLTNARRALIDRGYLAEETAPTKGGRSIAVLVPAPAHRKGITTAVAKAAARKRVLYTRYLSWAMGGAEYSHGLIGPGTELVVRASISAAGSLREVTPGAGEVPTLLGVDLNGPLDSGGILPTGSLQDPGSPIAVAVEVKSLRQWIYPQAQELYQILHKAAMVQRDTTSSLPVLPVLVCRKAHYTAFRMAKQLGFYILAMDRQYLNAASIDATHLVEVRAELGFTDLVEADQARDTKVIRAFREVMPEQVGHSLAELWRETCLNTNISEHFQTLRNDTISTKQRAQHMAALRQTAASVGRHTGW